MKNQTPNKMNNLLQKLEAYKSQNNPKRFSMEKTPRKSSLNFYLQQEDFIRRNSFQNHRNSAIGFFDIRKKKMCR